MNLKYIKQNIISLENPRRTKAKEPKAQGPEGFPSVVLALFRLLSLPYSSNHRSLKAHSQPLPQVGILCVVCCCLVVSDALCPNELQPSRLLCPWGFSRQEYWSGLPCSPPGDFPNPGVEPRSPVLQVDSLPSKPPGIIQLLLIPSKNLEGIEFIYFHRHKGEEQCEGASQVAQMVKCLPAIQETRVRSLGQEDPLKKEMVTHSSTLAQKIPWMEEPGRLQSMGLQRVGYD